MNRFYENGQAIVNAHNQDRKSVPYYALYNLFTGSPQATILLTQISYWWSKNERKPFYKFKMPCGHKAYKEGDSWSEELLFTEYQFDGAIKKIGIKVKAGESKEEALKNSTVIYWIDRDRMTWYQLNEKLFYTLVGQVYEDPSGLANQEKSGYSNQEKPDYISNTENTTEITTQTSDNEFIELFGEKITKSLETVIEAKDLLTPEGRAKLQEHLVSQRQAKLEKNPWLTFNSGRYSQRGEVSAESLQVIDWMIYNVTGLECNTPNKKTLSHWLNGLAEIYHAANGDIPLIRKGINTTWQREYQYRPSSPHGFVAEIRKLRAAKKVSTYSNNTNEGRIMQAEVVHIEPEE